MTPAEIENLVERLRDHANFYLDRNSEQSHDMIRAADALAAQQGWNVKAADWLETVALPDDLEVLKIYANQLRKLAQATEQNAAAPQIDLVASAFQEANGDNPAPASAAAPAPIDNRVVYQCPRCATSMEVDPTVKPSPLPAPEPAGGMPEGIDQLLIELDDRPVRVIGGAESIEARSQAMIRALRAHALALQTRVRELEGENKVLMDTLKRRGKSMMPEMEWRKVIDVLAAQGEKE